MKGIADKKISFVFQEDRLLPWVSAKKNILAVNPDEALCMELLDRVGLQGQENKLPSELSGGMSRRIAIARALAYDGDIFLLDEPFKGFDVKLKRSMMDFIQTRTKNKLCVFVTHEIEEAQKMADKVLILGGPPLEIKKELDLKKYGSDYLQKIVNEML